MGIVSSATLDFVVKYRNEVGSVTWQGRVVEREENFRRYLRDKVRPRVSDAEASFASDLRGLAMAGMETKFVERLLQSAALPKPWEIGEALAECTLRDSGVVHWPWNTVRDRRTPRASLPGADLVGFHRDGESAQLLLGQVKTSAELASPPRVMKGSDGMQSQLTTCAMDLGVQHSVMQWLHARCKSGEMRQLYEIAMKRFLASEGADIAVVGVLVRDTAANESDLRASGQALSGKLLQTRVELLAWHLPLPISDWPTLVQEQSS